MSAFAVAALLLLSSASVQSTGAETPPDRPKIPPATLDDTLDVVGDSLAAQQVRTRMFVQVEVNGKGPFRFLVDSGADRTAISQDLAQRLGLPVGKTVTLRSMAGASRVETVGIDHLKIGTSVIDDISAPALPERFLGAQGLLGIDALAEQRVMLDFNAKTVTVQDSRRPVQSLPGEIIVTARRRNGQLILTQVSFRDDRLYAVLDTGAEVTMGNSALQARVFRGRKPPPMQEVTLISVTGQTIKANSAVLPELKIGGVVLRNVRVAFADAPPFELFGLDKQPALLLGTDVLEVFRRVSLDFRNRKVRFVVRR